MASIYAKIGQGSPLVEPTEGRPNVYGSFTTTVPATPWLRAHLSLLIPRSTKHSVRQRDLDCGYDTPPDSPLSFFSSGSMRSPSISRTLTDFDCSPPSASPAQSNPSTSPPSPLISNVPIIPQLHPVLEAIEKRSMLSCKTVCSACKKTGANFPRCPRCGEMWCSRACRLQGGKKHICANSSAV